MTLVTGKMWSKLKKIYNFPSLAPTFLFIAFGRKGKKRLNSPGSLYNVISLQLICNKLVSLGKHLHIVFRAQLYVISRFVYKTLSLSSFQHKDILIQHIIMKLLTCSQLDFFPSILKRSQVMALIWNYLRQKNYEREKKKSELERKEKIRCCVVVLHWRTFRFGLMIMCMDFFLHSLRGKSINKSNKAHSIQKLIFHFRYCAIGFMLCSIVLHWEPEIYLL